MQPPIFFAIHTRSSPLMVSGKPYYVFKDFRNTLTSATLTVGLPNRFIYTEQDINGNITLPKGLYKVTFQSDFLLEQYVATEMAHKITYVNLGLKYFVDDVETNDRTEGKYQARSETLPDMHYYFNITNDTGKFRIDTLPSFYIEDKLAPTYRLSLKNITVTIQSVGDLPDVTPAE